MRPMVNSRIEYTAHCDFDWNGHAIKEWDRLEAADVGVNGTTGDIWFVTRNGELIDIVDLDELEEREANGQISKVD